MAGILDSTAMVGVLKIRYSPRKVETLGYKNNPFMALVRKTTDFTGKNRQIAVRYGTTAGASSVFSNAMSNTSADKYASWNVTRWFYYTFATITDEMFYAAKGSEGTMAEGLSNLIDGCIYKASRAIAIQMYRNGGGSIGRVSAGSTVGSTAITLTTIQDITNFEVGDVLQAAADDGVSASAGVRSGTVTVTKVDRGNGILTTTGNWNAVGNIPGIATSDWLFRQGDYQNVMKGALGNGAAATANTNGGGWIQDLSSSTSDSFYGFDRTVDTRLSGVIYNGNGAPYEESLIEALARLTREGAKPTHAFVNPLNFSTLLKALSGKLHYTNVDQKSKAGISFKGVEVHCSEGPVAIVPDVNCPFGQSLVTQLDTWAYESLGKAPRILDGDGNMLLRDPTSDSYSLRVGVKGALTNWAPNYSCNLTW